MPSRISVCIPVYNGAAFLAAAVESALGQDAPDFEVVVCDNASTDGTSEIAARFGSRIRHERFEDHVGQAANWNRCLRLAGGDHVVLLHADDLLLPGHLKAAAAMLDSHPRAGFVHCAVQHIAEDGKPLRLQRLQLEDGLEDGHAFVRRLLTDGCIVNPAGPMIRRAALDAAGPFAEQIVWGVDWQMWIRLALTADVAYLASPLAAYRHHGGSGTTAVFASGRHTRDETWAVEDLAASRSDFASLAGLAWSGVARRAWFRAEEACQAGALREARAGLRAAVALDPRLLLAPRTWALGLATFFGYDLFETARRWKSRLGGGAPSGG